MKDLLQRLEAAVGPSRELADEVLLACGWTRARELERGTVMETWKSPDMQGKCAAWEGELPNPLESMDAALLLVPEGWQWDISNCAVAPHTGRAWINNKELQLAGLGGLRKNPKYVGFEYTASIPAIALSMTCVEAHQSIQESSHE